MIVDAISSYAAIPIDMKEMNISYLIASSNKNLQGMAGISFVICNKKYLETIKSQEPRNFYMNLYAQYDYFVKNHQMRFTPPVQTLYALKQAILETKEETIEKRYERYKRCWDILIAGLKELRLSFLVDEKFHSKLITSINEPLIENYSFEDMHDFLKKRGYTIYPGKIGELKTFRISNIGNINEEDMKEFILELKNYFLYLKEKEPQTK
jgi:2-aminoethylphosphonate-pyruvate transaminase